MTLIHFTIGLYPFISIFFHQYLTFGLIYFSASGVGLLISSIAPSVEAAAALVTPMVFPMLIFSGVLLKTMSTPLYFIWIKYLVWTSYGYQNLIINQWQNVGFCAPTEIVSIFNWFSKLRGVTLRSQKSSKLLKTLRKQKLNN